MRTLTQHKVNPCNDQIELTVLDEPGQGNACHVYQATLPGGPGMCISFQNGPINEVGVNGITQEVLLAIIEDRLMGFQSGDYACAENADALRHVRAAMAALHARTSERMTRGVEGTHAI